jgi:hypothetical protein
VKVDGIGAAARRERYILAAAALALAVIYFASRTERHNWDAVAYAAVADVPAAGAMFHQNHPLFTPALWLVVRAFRACGYAGPSLMPAAALSAAFAAAAAALFYLALRRLGAAAATAALATGAAAFSAAWWFYAGEAEVVSCISFFIAGALFILAPASPRRGRAVAAACWLGAATWFHMTIALFVPVAAVLLAEPREGRWLRLATFGGAYLVVAAVPYVIISQFVYGHAGAKGLWAWVNIYESAHEEWGVWSARGFRVGLLTVLTTAVSPGLNYGWDIWGTKFSDAAARLAPAAVLVGGALAAVVAAAPRLWREKRRWLLAGALWFVGYQLFFSWWNYGNAEWWVATAMPLWFLFGLAAPSRRAFVIPAAAFIMTFAGVNFGRLILPATRPGRDLREEAARAIVAVTRPGDSLWVSDCSVAIWVKYLSRNTRSVVETRAAFNPRSYVELVASSAGPAGEPPAAGPAVYLTDAELDNPHLKWVDAATRDGLFTVVRSAEAVALLRLPEGECTLLRCRPRCRKLEDLRLYEAEKGPGPPYAVLYGRAVPASFNVVVPRKGRYVLCVQARGERTGAAWPTMQISRAGRWIAFAPVVTNYWRFYEVTTELDAGAHDIDVFLCNPFRDPASGRDRLLLVNRLAVYRARPAKRLRARPRSVLP